MKNLSVVFIFISLSAFAQQTSDPCANAQNPDSCRADAAARVAQQQGGNGNNNNNNNNNIPFSDCRQTYTSAVPQPLAEALGVVPTVPPAAPITVTLVTEQNQNGTQAQVLTAPQPTAIPKTMNDSVKKCRAFEAMSGQFGASLQSTDSKRSQDGRITCTQKSGITADYPSCVSALGMYNSILVAEAVMQQYQGFRTNQVQTQAGNEAAQRAAAGDGQSAMFDAQTANLNNAKELNQQQAAAYAAAVAALYSKIQSWIKETPEALSEKGCGARAPAQQEGQPALPVDDRLYATVNSVPRPRGQECAIHSNTAFTDYRGIVYANKEAKAAFTTAAMMFAAKALQAGIKASQLGAIAKQVQDVKNAGQDDYNPAQFEFCTVSPNDPRCAGQSTRTPGSGITDGGFSFGDSFGNNAVGGLGDEEQLGNGPLDPLNPGDSVADVSNPFADDAKKASGILDPAAAASIQPGAAGGGGGGGGAPGAGGGSASLGNDVPGVDESKKENDIKANKADGKYSDAAGGGGFQAIKPLKEDNPFANLFGGQGGGKLEEDRSIASGDIDGQDSGLFSKISKRYGQVQADKRIEAKNLEE